MVAQALEPLRVEARTAADGVFPVDTPSGALAAVQLAAESLAQIRRTVARWPWAWGP